MRARSFWGRAAQRTETRIESKARLLELAFRPSNVYLSETSLEIIQRSPMRLFKHLAQRIDLEAIDKLCTLFDCEGGDLLEHAPDNVTISAFGPSYGVRCLRTAILPFVWTNLVGALLLPTNTKKGSALGSTLPFLRWQREPDLNQRPSGYEPDELPDCSTPQQILFTQLWFS